MNKKLQKIHATTCGPLHYKELEPMNWLNDPRVSPPFLAIPYSNGHMTRDTNAYNVHVERMLLPWQPDRTIKAFGYWSRSITESTYKHDTTKRVLFTIDWRVFLIRIHLEGTRYTIRTGHESLERILNLTDRAVRRAHWRLQLSKFQTDIVHCIGVKQQDADAPPR